MTWQDGVTWLIVASAVGFLVDRFVFVPKRRKKVAGSKPDVPASALVRKRPRPKDR